MGHWWGTCRTREQAWFFIQGSACPARGCKKGAQGPCTPSSIQTREKKHKSRFGMNQEFRRRASSSLLVQSASLSQGVIHSLGVWGPKRSTLNPRRQLGEPRALLLVSPVLIALCRGVWWHWPFPCTTGDSAGREGRLGMGASHQLLQDPSILPGSLFTPSPSREQTLPRSRACGCICYAGGDSLCSQAKSTAGETSYPPSSPVAELPPMFPGQFHVCI